MSRTFGHGNPAEQMKRILVAGLLTSILTISDALALDTVSAMNVIVPEYDQCTQTYSPTVVKDPTYGLYHMWVGGWRTCGERDIDNNDKIFYAVSTNLQDWFFDSQPVIRSPSMHFNDPTVVVIDYPNGHGSYQKLFLMYMTGCGTAADCESEGGNQTYGATSWDGSTWSAPQLVIGKNNGFNEGGAWSPSALLGPDQKIWLYYHDVYGKPLRSIIDPQVDFFSATPAVPLSVPSGRQFLVNVDVTRTPGGMYEMLYDFADSDPTFRVRRLISSDGLTFQEDSTFFNIDGRGLLPPHRALTAHAAHVDGSQYMIFFGWARAPTDAPISTHGWLVHRAAPR